jgi:ABC-type multidrug transport system fused ATPase/permease subunit
MKARDVRNKLITDMTNSIFLIKTSSLEDFYLRSIQERREEELRCLRNQNICLVASIFLNWSSAGLILSATFFMYYYLGHTITAARAFEIVLVFAVIGYAIKQVPDSINNLIRTWTSVKRIEKFLLGEELDLSHIHLLPQAPLAVSVSRSSHSWVISKEKEEDKEGKAKEDKARGKDSALNESLVEEPLLAQEAEGGQKKLVVLRDIELRIPRGQLVVIVGDTKSGKSSLLQVVLGEIRRESDCRVEVGGSVAYCPQKAWIRNCTVEENITMSDPYD